MPYDVGWTERYVETSTRLRKILGPGWLTEHVGSTSVPGLLAKPVIDLARRIPEGTCLPEIGAAFLQAGWTEPRTLGDHSAAFLLAGPVREAIAHLFTPEQWPEAHVRLFADWLRTHETDRARYAALKRGLVAEGTWDEEYTDAKSTFVLEVVNRAREARALQPVSGPL